MNESSEAIDHGSAARDGDVRDLNELTVPESRALLAAMAGDMTVLDRAIAGVQQALAEAELPMALVALTFEQDAPTLECRCGSRCVEWRDVPYERCWNENGRRVCVRGYRRECARTACNPCAEASSLAGHPGHLGFRATGEHVDDLGFGVLPNVVAEDEKADAPRRTACAVLYWNGSFEAPNITITQGGIDVVLGENVQRIQLRHVSSGGTRFFGGGRHSVEPGEYVLSLWGSTYPHTSIRACVTYE